MKRNPIANPRTFLAHAQRALVLALVPLLGACLDTGRVDDVRLATWVADWRDEIIYQVVVDRFADGNLNNDDNIDPTGLAHYQGGDWQGLIDHLDYLEALGVTAIWISPVVRNVDTDANVDGYHGYWAQDLTATNPHMGDLAKLRELVRRAHGRGFKVILDIVTNHLGQLFYYDINNNGVPDETVSGYGFPPPAGSQNGNGSTVQHVTEYDPDFDPRGIQSFTSLGESGPAPIRFLFLPEIHRMPPLPVEFQNPAWYNRRGRVTAYDPTPSGCQPPLCVVCDLECSLNQTRTGDFPGGLKDLKTLRPDVQRALTDVFWNWIQAADFDGFRIDTLKHVEYEFWDYFAPEIRRRAAEAGKNNFLMFGEAFDGRDSLVASYTSGSRGVDSAFFFPQKFAVIDRVIKYNSESTRTIENQFNTLFSQYGTAGKQNGPTDGDDGSLLGPTQLMVNFMDNHDVARFLYDKPSIPALHQAIAFLFTEIGIPCIYYGTEQQFRGGNDPANRERLWDTGFSTNGPTFRWIRRLADVRKKYKPLRRGDLQIRWSTDRNGDSDIDAGIFAFERTREGKRVLVVLNVKDDQNGQYTRRSTTQSPTGGTMTVGFPPGTELVDVLADIDQDRLPVTVSQSGRVQVSIVPRGVRVFVAREDFDGIP